MTSVTLQIGKPVNLEIEQWSGGSVESLSFVVRRLMDFHASEVNEVLVSASLLITSGAILTLRAGYSLIFGSVYITPSTHSHLFPF